MRYARIDPIDTANGSGVGVVLWVQGCSIHCPGCHNPKEQAFGDGQSFDDEAMRMIMECAEKPWVTRLTITGGHPLEPENAADVSYIARQFKTRYPDKKIWLYTGRTVDANQCGSGGIGYNGVLICCDYVVDGAFIQEQADAGLAFRGSRNQRIIDVEKTSETGEIVLKEEWKPSSGVIKLA